MDAARWNVAQHLDVVQLPWSALPRTTKLSEKNDDFLAAGAQAVRMYEADRAQFAHLEQEEHYAPGCAVHSYFYKKPAKPGKKRARCNWVDHGSGGSFCPSTAASESYEAGTVGVYVTTVKTLVSTDFPTPLKGKRFRSCTLKAAKKKGDRINSGMCEFSSSSGDFVHLAPIESAGGTSSTSSASPADEAHAPHTAFAMPLQLLAEPAAAPCHQRAAQAVEGMQGAAAGTSSNAAAGPDAAALDDPIFAEILRVEGLDLQELDDVDDDDAMRQEEQEQQALWETIQTLAKSLDSLCACLGDRYPGDNSRERARTFLKEKLSDALRQLDAGEGQS